MNAAAEQSDVTLNSPMKILLASLIGTTIEYFDFYIFGTAAVLVFPKLFLQRPNPAWPSFSPWLPLAWPLWPDLWGQPCLDILATEWVARPRWWLPC